jgi:hypothetical protein
MPSSYLESSLTHACPSFAREWAALRATYPPGSPPSAEEFLDAMRVHVHRLLTDGHVAESARLFSALERLLTGADPVLEDLLVRGFLCRLAADCRETALDPRLVRPHLGPRARAAWDRALAS